VASESDEMKQRRKEKERERKNANLVADLVRVTHCVCPHLCHSLALYPYTPTRQSATTNKQTDTTCQRNPATHPS
jgi:hypothetical protein